VSLVVATFNERCNNASAVLFLSLGLEINDSSAENLTGLKQSTDIMLVTFSILEK